MKLRKHLCLLAAAFSAAALQAQQLPLDPLVRRGTLPNGLTYYIAHNGQTPQVADFYIAQRVGSILHLSEAELMEITHFERGSALISTNNNNIAVEIKCSQMEKELITTDRRELAELAQRAAPKQHPC